jgi:hypothetical protein
MCGRAWVLLPSFLRFVSLLSDGGKYCGGFSNLYFANPIAPVWFHDRIEIVSYTLARLSHADERPLLVVSPVLGILETANCHEKHSNNHSGILSRSGEAPKAQV